MKVSIRLLKTNAFSDVILLRYFVILMIIFAAKDEKSAKTNAVFSVFSNYSSLRNISKLSLIYLH